MPYLLCVLGFCAVLVGGAAAATRETVQRNIHILGPWVQATSASRVRLHLTIANTGVRADRLVRVATSLASKVSILDQEGREGGGLTIPGGAEFVIGGNVPGIELIGLRRTLAPAEKFNLLLVFERAGKVYVDVVVGPDRVHLRLRHGDGAALQAMAP